jgi:hypothetical protein
MTYEQACQVPLVARLHFDVVVITCGKQEFFTFVEFSSFNASLTALSTMLITLSLQNMNCTSSQGLVMDAVNELKQILCFILLLH